jgi:hypothetical protein
MESSATPPQHVSIASHEGGCVSWWEGYLNAILGISLFGGQITFTVILSEIADPATLHANKTALFSKETARLFVAISWMLFTITLGLAAVIRILISDVNLKEAANKGFKNGSRWIRLAHSLLTLFLNGLPIAAFLFLALAVVAYVPIVGWITLGLISFFLIAAGGCWWWLDC